MAFQFYVATARWLTQLATGVDIGMDGNVEMESLKTVKPVFHVELVGL
jgi:hypothetical protein